MAYDTFVGLAADQSIQGATWDDGGISWLNPTYLVGDGANGVKIGTMPSTTHIVLSNYLAAESSRGQALFFTLGAGKASSGNLITLTTQGDGSTPSSSSKNGISARLTGLNFLQCVNLADNTKTEVSCGALSESQQYCLEIERTSNANNREYVVRLYMSTNGVRGTLVATTPALTISAERAATDRVAQAWRGSSTSTPNLTIQRAESLEPIAAVAPVLSVPTATATSSTSVSGTVATDKAGGTLRYLFSANTTETAATLKASGASQVVTATGSQTVNITGRTAGETGRIHYLQVDAGSLESNVVSSSPVTLPAPDSTAPTFASGAAITPGTITSSSLSGSYPAATDNVAVTGYQYSINSGSSWVDNGTGTTFTINGLSPSTTYPVWVRAKDAAGNFSTPLQTTMATSAPAGGGGTLTTTAFKNGTGQVLANLSGLNVSVLSLPSLGLVKSFSGRTTNASGINSVSDTAIVAGTKYAHVTTNSTGTVIGAELITAT